MLSSLSPGDKWAGVGGSSLSDPSTSEHAQHFSPYGDGSAFQESHLEGRTHIFRSQHSGPKGQDIYADDIGFRLAASIAEDATFYKPSDPPPPQTPPPASNNNDF